MSWGEDHHSACPRPSPNPACLGVCTGDGSPSGDRGTSRPCRLAGVSQTPSRRPVWQRCPTSPTRQTALPRFILIARPTVGQPARPRERWILPQERCSGPPRLYDQAFSQVSAPGRIRTRDPLLRRQLLCPAELRAPERNCARPRSRDGHAKVPVCRPLATQIRPRVRQQPTVPEPTVNDDSSATSKPLNCGSAQRCQPARAHGRSGPESPQREKNAQEAAAALGPRGSEYRAKAGSAEPPDQ